MLQQALVCVSIKILVYVPTNYVAKKEDYPSLATPENTYLLQLDFSSCEASTDV